MGGEQAPDVTQTGRLVPPHTTYIESFLGSGCLFFALDPRHSILGDSNRALIETYRAVRDAPEDVARRIQALDDTPAGYYATRALDPRTLDRIGRAARFVFLNKRCFNGVYRTNRSGHFNVPLGSRTGLLPTKEILSATSRALRHASLVCGDFETTLARAGCNAFVYLDPPYSPNRPRRGEYGYNCFSDTDLERFISAVRQADGRGAKILISYSDSPALRSALSSWTQRWVFSRRFVSADPRARIQSRDLLICNYCLPTFDAL